MTKSRNYYGIIVIAAVLLVAIATLVKDGLNRFNDLHQAWDSPWNSKVYSERNGTFVCEVKFGSKGAQWGDQNIIFTRGWIEHRVKSSPYLVWWRRVEAVSNDYYLIVQCDTDRLNYLPGIFLYRVGATSGFDKHGSDCFSNILSAAEFEKGHAAIYIGQAFQSSPKSQISISWKSD